MFKIALAGATALALLPLAARAQQAPSPTSNSPDQIALPEVSVSAPRVSVQGYLAPENTTALKIPAAIQDVPASVQVVPQALIQDRGATTLRQAIETVSGVESTNALPNTLAVRIRGFTDAGTSLRDGFREQSNQQDIQGVERIEVLKGPASVLYGGTVSSGGVVNVVTKAPVDGSFVRTGLTGGSFGLFRSTLDANQGDVTGDGKLAVRLNAAYDHANSFRTFGYNENTFINPTVRWRPTSQDEVIFRAQYLHSNFSFSQYQSPLAQKTLGLPLSFSFVDPSLGDTSRDAWRLDYDWIHTFDSGVKFRSGFNASIVNTNIGSSRFLSFPLAANGRTLSRTVTQGPQTAQDFDLQNELSGTAYTGPFRHDWLTGVEVYRSLSDTKSLTATLPALNLLNPVYGVVPGRFSLNSRTRSRVEAAAGYLQDFIALTPQVHLLVGGRYDATDTVSNNLLAGTRSPNAANKFSPRVGLTYEPVPTTALYFNWANSFVPTTATTIGGAALPPGSSEQFEVGVKQELLNKRVQGTVALFQITRSNVPTPNPVNPLFSIASGEQQSRGVEVDMAGEITPGWKAIASYAYTFADVTQDNRLPIGSVLAGVAKHAGQIWTTYEFPEGTALAGFGFGGGVRAETKREATLPNSFKLPGYVRLDAAAWQRFNVRGRPLRAQINVQNLTDARIYDTDGAATLRPQLPLSVLGTISAEF